MEDLNQLPTVIPISYDAKRTRNRLAQRRRRGLSYFLQTKNGHANLSNVAAEKQKSLSTLEKGSTSSHSATKEAAQLHNPTPDMLGWAQQGETVQCTAGASVASTGGGDTLVPSPWADSIVGTLALQEQQSDLLFLYDEAAFTSSGNFVLEASLTPHPLTPSPRLDPELGQMVRTSSSPLLQRRTLPAAGQLCEAIPSPTLARDANNGTHMISQPVASPLISPAKSSASTVSATSAANRLGDANAGAEQSIAKILILAEEMGFDSFDDLAATYYTATFSEGSLPRYAQSTSRSRRLRGLLTELHTSSRSWMGREARGYSDGQMRLLETVCVEELSGISAGEQHQIHRTQAFITNMIKQLFTHDGAEQRLEKDKDRLREQIPSLWALLSQVAQNINPGAEDSSLAICVFVYLLQVPL